MSRGESLYRLVTPVSEPLRFPDLEDLVKSAWTNGALAGPRPVFRNLHGDGEDGPKGLRSYTEVVFDRLEAAVNTRRFILQHTEGRHQVWIEEVSCDQGNPGDGGWGSCSTYPPGTIDTIVKEDRVRDAQEYLDKTPPDGIHAASSHSHKGGKGAGVRVAVLDQAFDPFHRDLLDSRIRLLWGRCESSCGACHGTQALGVLCASGRGRHLHGVVPEAEVLLAPLSCELDEMVSPENACWNAITDLPPGSVLLLEREVRMVLDPPVPGRALSPWLPAEAWPPARRVLQQLVARGIFVVQSAGNGNANLDRYIPSDPGEGDSGSILVGAGCPWELRRAPHSNWGKRIDVHSWGDQVITTQGGSGCSRNGAHKAYHRDFGGTSAAAAIVAGMVASLSGIWKGRFPDGPALSPAKMREIVSNSQWSGNTRNGIGSRANFPNALAALGRWANQQS